MCHIVSFILPNVNELRVIVQCIARELGIRTDLACVGEEEYIIYFKPLFFKYKTTYYIINYVTREKFSYYKFLNQIYTKIV